MKNVRMCLNFMLLICVSILLTGCEGCGCEDQIQNFTQRIPRNTKILHFSRRYHGGFEVLYRNRKVDEAPECYELIDQTYNDAKPIRICEE